jgi:hypothetical protein
MRLAVDPTHGHVYMSCGSSKAVQLKNPDELVRINPESGEARVVPSPLGSTDFTFDQNGYAYFRTDDKVVRYQPSDSGRWREVPFDYGEQWSKVGYAKAAPVISALVFPGDRGSHQQYGGIGVSHKGHIVVASPYAVARKQGTRNVHAGVEHYEPRVYPGRTGTTLVSVFDRQGKALRLDAFHGANVVDGIRIDKDDNLYVQVSGLPTVEGTLPPNANLVGCTLIKAKAGKFRMLAQKAVVPLSKDRTPARPPDFFRHNRFQEKVWVEGAEWMYPDVGLSALETPPANCHCTANARFDLDYFARAFATQVPRYRIVVLDTNGNVITHIGRCGNVDDGMPLVREGGPPDPRSIGGDETAIMNCLQLAVHTDRRLFVSDIGNYCIRSVKLTYRLSERVKLGK